MNINDMKARFKEGFKIKANNGKGNNSLRDSWKTPQDLFIKLDNQYNFSIDCCANELNKKTDIYFNDFQNENNLDGYVCWMNPPFSKAIEMFKHFFKVVIKGIAIYRCDNLETKLWQEIILTNATWIFIPKGRICYEGMEGKGSRFPSALIGFNLDIPKNLEGTTLFIKK